AAILECRDQIATDPVQSLCHAEALGILLGDLQGPIRTINCPHVRLWQRMRQTDRQVATPRPHIQDSKMGVRMRYTPFLCQMYTLLDQYFAFRAWDEHVRIYGEFQRPEFLLSRDVLHWLTVQPALQAFQVGRLLAWAEGACRIQVELRSCHPQ